MHLLVVSLAAYVVWQAGRPVVSGWLQKLPAPLRNAVVTGAVTLMIAEGLEHPGWWLLERALAGAGGVGLLVTLVNTVTRHADDGMEKMMSTVIHARRRRPFPAPPGSSP